MAHHLLLNSDCSLDGIQPATISMPKGVSAEMPDSCFLGCSLKFTPKPRVRIGKMAQLQRTGKDPVVFKTDSSRKSLAIDKDLLDILLVWKRNAQFSATPF